jgi:hypothetical protein
MKTFLRGCVAVIILVGVAILFTASVFALDREDIRQEEKQQLQKEFSWWPTDAKPAPVRDEVRGGYWWWPSKPGDKSPSVWGNRGYC